MSMISEQIKELRKMSQNYPVNIPIDLFERALSDAADTIETLSAKLQAANMERSTAYYNGGWIPCSERLPQNNGEYICTQEIYSLSSGKMINKTVEMVEFLNGEWRRGKHLKVIAWQPLPEPYKPQ